MFGSVCTGFDRRRNCESRSHVSNFANKLELVSCISLNMQRVVGGALGGRCRLGRWITSVCFVRFDLSSKYEDACTRRNLNANCFFVSTVRQLMRWRCVYIVSLQNDNINANCFFVSIVSFFHSCRFCALEFELYMYWYFYILYLYCFDRPLDLKHPSIAKAEVNVVAYCWLR